jgi:hypothetical protein
MCYNNGMQNKSIYFLAIALIIGFGLGFFFGQMNGQNMGAAQADVKYKPIVDSIYPAPPQVLHSVAGIVKSVYGAEVTMEINDPNDYLPHFDGTPVNKISVVAETYANTKINSVDYTKLDKNGNPQIKAIKLGDLKIDAPVSVRSSSNIRGADKFDVTEIDLIIK